MTKQPDIDQLEARERLERLARLIRSAGHDQGLIPAQWDVLRYLARANRFSNSPIATAQYLGATKGTISQTILALVRKNLVARGPRGKDNRSIALSLTDQGLSLLAQDPLQALAANMQALSPKTARRMARGIAALLDKETERQGQPPFGTCPGCRFFMMGEVPACAAFGQRLEPQDLGKLCFKFRPAPPQIKAKTKAKSKAKGKG